MKIAIFTLPLSSNYGGILQTYALQKVLESCGHEAILLNITWRVRDLLLCIAKIIFFRKYRNKQFTFFDRDATRFINENIKKTRPIHLRYSLKKEFLRQKFDACILGSDQVFVPSFFGPIFQNLFSLSFVPDNCIKMTYAASFGTNNQEYILSKIRNLDFHKKKLHDFKAISVREESGLSLLKTIFDIDNAQVLLDPTLIANKSIFERFICETEAKDKLFAYILDPNEQTSKVLSSLSRRENLEIYEVNDRSNRMSIEKWISSISKARLIITDSFHGCIFSIIFHNQFFAFINEKRGNDRLESLFNMLNLNDRIIKSTDDICMNKMINFESIDKILCKLRGYSLDYISSVLKNVK